MSFATAVHAPTLMPHIAVGDWFENIVDWIKDHLSWLLTFIKVVLKNVDHWLAEGLIAVPTIVMIIILVVLALALRGWQFAVFTAVGLLIIDAMSVGSLDLWESSMYTLALVIIAGAIAMVLALPLGVLAARNSTVSAVIRPVLDFMQTLPPFVYLIPAVVFFAIGAVPGLLSTIIFAMPPGVRLTELGIRQVDGEMVEAGQAFGAKPSSILARIQIPLAMPTIMAGINQVIMLSLSMVVIAGMVGAKGLGQDVYSAVTTVNIAKGFASGLAVVILAIYLDRLTAAMGDRSAVARAAKATAK